MFLSEESQSINEDDKRLFSLNLERVCKVFLNHCRLQPKVSCKVRDEYDCLQKVLLPGEVAKNFPTTRSTPGT